MNDLKVGVVGLGYVGLPILEQSSGMKLGDFKIGYSPERINSGDKERTIDKIKKIVSGCDKETLEKVAEVYGLIINAGLHKAPNIKTAEAAKVIENIQRDLNIALMNELAMIFGKLGIKTQDVLEAAGTNCYNMQVPQQFFDLNKELKEELLKGLFDENEAKKKGFNYISV